MADIDIISHHRVGMFRDMGQAPAAIVDELAAATRGALRELMPRGEYLGWLAAPAGEPNRIVSGAGVQVRRMLPRPLHWPDGTDAVAHGKQAIVLNVYTEPEYRRRGAARLLMEAVIAWARGARVESLVLHAAPDGKTLYESLGFSPTNEMRFLGDLRS